MQVTIDGLDEVQKLFKELSDEKNWMEIMTILITNTLSEAMNLAPEDTGLMEESIEIRNLGDTWELFIDGRKVPYAFFNEYGTYYKPAGEEDSPISYISTSGKACYRPFLRVAAYRALDDLDEIISEFWNRFI